MSKIQNFANEFEMHIENEMPKLVNRLNDTKNKFAQLTIGLYVVLSDVDRALTKEGRGFMRLTYSKLPDMDGNYVMFTKMTIKNLNDEHDIEIYYVGGDATEVTMTGAEEFAHHFGNLKGIKRDAMKKEIRFSVDTPPDELAASFAALFTEFYTVR